MKNRNEKPFKKLIPIIYLKDDKAYTSVNCRIPIDLRYTPDEIAVKFTENGADGLIVMDMSYDDESHEKAISMLRVIAKKTDIPVYAGGNVNRVEDVKKYLYAGAVKVFLEDSKESNLAMMKEVSDRFGSDKLALWYTGADKQALQMACDDELSCIFASDFDKNVLSLAKNAGIPAIVELVESTDGTDIITELSCRSVMGVSGPMISNVDFSFMEAKQALKDAGISMNTFESLIPFSEFKLNEQGLIPVVVQDYKTDEVLMVAYMNEEAYNATLATGRMTYYSRSRQELWLKGETSGHFQYVRSIEIDCDNDTLLAKVKQIGAACHTGNRSCFYRNLVTTEYAQVNPLKVFNSVMEVIEDRKINPKEGSYTNYLFDKGIDKILKKVGEEASEIIIAAKNPDPEESKYEIADFLYHVMVLMSLKGLTWEDIVKELANR